MVNSEDFEGKMIFIADQQAQFAVGMQHLREMHAETESIVARLAYATLEGFKDVNAKINALVDSHIRMEDAMLASHRRTEAARADSEREVSNALKKLAASQDRTEEELRQLFAKVDDRRKGE